MTSIMYYFPRSDEGQYLLDEYIVPICARRNTRLFVAPTNATRENERISRKTHNLVVMDLSTDADNVYRGLSEWMKLKRTIVLSRTCLPRNVTGSHQLTPIHAHRLCNDDIGALFDKLIFDLSSGNEVIVPDDDRLSGYYWRRRDASDNVFISWRGTVRNEALLLAAFLREIAGRQPRLVPECEYSYPTECVTTQQMWEGVAKLNWEIGTNHTFIALLSRDYFSSFWTMSELLQALLRFNRAGRFERNNTDDKLLAVDFENPTAVLPLMSWLGKQGVPIPSRNAVQINHDVINVCDPMTASPEIQFVAHERGIRAWLWKRIMNKGTFSHPEMLAQWFWQDLRVPCPNCRPKDNAPVNTNWDEHTSLAPPHERVDAFGYFLVSRQEIDSHSTEVTPGKRCIVTCPQCRRGIMLISQREPRHLWAPILSFERNQERSVLIEQPVWEVVG